MPPTLLQTNNLHLKKSKNTNYSLQLPRTHVAFSLVQEMIFQLFKITTKAGSKMAAKLWNYCVVYWTKLYFSRTNIFQIKSLHETYYVKQRKLLSLQNITSDRIFLISCRFSSSTSLSPMRASPAFATVKIFLPHLYASAACDATGIAFWTKFPTFCIVFPTHLHNKEMVKSERLLALGIFRIVFKIDQS